MSTTHTQQLGAAIALADARATDIGFLQQEFQVASALAGPRMGWVVTNFGDSYDWSHGYGWDLGNSVALEPDGKILVAGTTENGTTDSYDLALARYNADGSLDKSFSGDGKLTTDFGSGYSSDNSVALQPDGKILVAGTTRNGTTHTDDFALARYNADGSLDKSFSGDGTLATDFGGGYDYGNSVALQPDGKILVAGATVNGPTDNYAA